MNNQIAVFYSQTKNSVLASKVKEYLNNFKIYTMYLNDIDDILLKKFTEIPLLILDYTQNILDKKSQELLDKLYEEEYVKRILVVYNSELNSFDKYPSVCYNENFYSNAISSIKEILSKPLKEKKFCDSHWVKIIGTHLNNIGFSLKHNGYFILIDAIIYVLSNKGVIKKLTEDVYSYLAIKHNKTISSIEMNIRKAINMAYNKNNNFPFDHCPTNKEFIIYAVTELFDKIYIKKVI